MACLQKSTAEEIVEEFSLKLKLARSAELALAGSLFKAEELLMSGNELPKSAGELDLLARILVRQKRYAEAKKRWNDALRVSPDETCYEKALIALEKHVMTLNYRRKLWISVISVVFLTLFVIACIQILKQNF